MNNKLIGKYLTSNFVDLGKIYPIGYALFKGIQPKKIQYSLDNVRYFEESVEIKDNIIDFSNLIARYIKFDSEVELEIYEGAHHVLR